MTEINKTKTSKMYAIRMNNITFYITLNIFLKTKKYSNDDNENIDCFILLKHQNVYCH